MKRLKKIVTGFLTFLLLAMTISPVTTVKAGDSSKEKTRIYTVTFRAGNVASFDTDRISSTGNLEVSENYIKVSVSKGDCLKNALAGTIQWNNNSEINSWLKNNIKINTEGRYALKDLFDTSNSGEKSNAATSAINRNVEYVLDYERLVDPVCYTVSYVDAESGEQIAAPLIVYGNAEETITITPAGITNYTPAENSKTLKLEKGKENTATFEYSYTGPVETVTSTVTNVTPGTTRTEITVNEIEEAVVVPGAEEQTGAVMANVVNNNAVNDANEDNINIPDEDTPLDDGADDVEIEDEETPFVDEVNQEDSAIAEIEDEETPLAAQKTTAKSMVVPMIGTVAALIIVFAAGVFLYRRKKATGKIEKEDPKKKEN